MSLKNTYKKIGKTLQDCQEQPLYEMECQCQNCPLYEDIVIDDSQIFTTYLNPCVILSILGKRLQKRIDAMDIDPLEG